MCHRGTAFQETASIAHGDEVFVLPSCGEKSGLVSSDVLFLLSHQVYIYEDKWPPLVLLACY